MRQGLIGASCAVLFAVFAAAAPASQIIGSDLSATPVEGCALDVYECTLTQFSASQTMLVPADGVITAYSIRHGADPSGMGSVELRILTGAPPTFTARRGEVQNDLLKSATAAVESFRFTDSSNFYRGIPVSTGERLALYSSEGALPLVAAGSGAAETAGSHASGAAIYTARSGQLLLQATLEPDVDHDGYGDDTQDGCVGIAGNCGGGSAGGTLTPFHAGEIQEFQARTISVYRAPTIGVYRSKVNLYDAILKGFSAPVMCSTACQIQAYASMRAISGALYGFAARPVIVARSTGRFPSGGDGKLRIPLTAQARRALRKARRNQILTLHLSALDWKGTVARRTVRVMLSVSKRH